MAPSVRVGIGGQPLDRVWHPSRVRSGLLTAAASISASYRGASERARGTPVPGIRLRPTPSWPDCHARTPGRGCGVASGSQRTVSTLGRAWRSGRTLIRAPCIAPYGPGVTVWQIRVGEVAPARAMRRVSRQTDAVHRWQRAIPPRLIKRPFEIRITNAPVATHLAFLTPSLGDTYPRPVARVRRRSSGRQPSVAQTGRVNGRAEASPCFRSARVARG